MKQAIAFIFRLKGKKTMPRDDFKMTVSMELHWFSPSEAEQFLEVAIQTNYMATDDDAIEPTFNVSMIDIPIDFTPAKSLLVLPEKSGSPEANVFMDIVSAIENETKQDKQTIISRINQVQSEMNIEIEAAALIIARECELDTNQFLESVKNCVIVKGRSS